MRANHFGTTDIAKSVSKFDLLHVLEELKHHLPAQTPIKDFIHHNTLHAFQHLKFYDAIFKARDIFGYQVTLQLKEFRKLFEIGRIKEEVLDFILSEKFNKDSQIWKTKLLNENYDSTVEPRIGILRSHCKAHFKIDLDNSVHPLLFRLLCSYLDQGVSLWKFPSENNSFIEALKSLENSNYSSFFKSKRARSLLLKGNFEIAELLKIIIGKEELYEQYIFDQQFAHPGWSGMVAAIEGAPNTLLDPRNITLQELIYLELLLEIDALDYALGGNWEPLSSTVNFEPINLFNAAPAREINEVLKLWQDAFEWSYYDSVLAGIDQGKKTNFKVQKSFQAIFCIDERECSLRRHVEQIDKNCETFGTPGFFGVEFYFKPMNAKFNEKLCPAPVTPKYLIKEEVKKVEREHELLYNEQTNTILYGTFATLVLGFVAGVKLASNLFRPKMSPAISNAFLHMHNGSKLSIENFDPNQVEDGLQIGFSIQEMANRVEGQLRSIGLVDNFATLVYFIAHGSSSANNPHHSAHDCGACSGRPGSVNARVIAFMANHKKVRAVLAERGIVIPDSTQFVGGMHDTASDLIAFFDEEELSDLNQQRNNESKLIFEKALNLNSKERTRRFASIDINLNLGDARKEIHKRSVSMFEPRPELGHGTNSLCVIGSRSLSKNVFLDRRSFLNSYDYNLDPNGDILVGVMRPIGIVCGGINLEYYFSRVDNFKFGAGTKLPHNVMGLIGVANSCDGDLRPGLPVQMIEVHDPVRLLIIVEHRPDVVLKVIQTTPQMYEWYINEWVHLVVLNPDDHKFYSFHEGGFVLYTPIKNDVKHIDDFFNLIAQSKQMETNQIIDSTQENLPVYLIN
jgi:uncharacterized protein YbcC (UPF0753/DUF2309 family)